MKALRIALAVLGGLLLILIVAAIILVNTFDPNDFKDELTAWVQDRTGRTLLVEDDIELSLFPWFAVETGGVTLSDDPAFGDRPFVSVDELSARIRVWPLLRRRIEIGRVILDGLSLDLAVDDDGRGNWSTLLATAAPEAPPAPGAEPGRPAIRRLAVEGVELRNTRVLWRDASGEVRYLVRDLRLVSGEIEDDAPVDLALSFSLLDVATQVSAEIELEAVAAAAPVPGISQGTARIRLLDPRNMERATAEIELESLVFADAVLRAGPVALTARLIDPPIGADRIELSAGLDALELELAGERLNITGLEAASRGIEASVDLSGTAILSDPALSGRIGIRGATLAALFETAGLATPPDLAGPDAGGFSADLAFAVDAAAATGTVERFALTALGMTARGSAARAADGAVSGRIEIPAFRPAAPLLALIAPKLPAGSNPGAIAAASLTTNFALAADARELVLDELAVTLDALRLSGKLAVPSPSDRSRIEGEIDAGGLDNTLLAALLGDSLPASLAAIPVGDFRLASRFQYTASTGRAVLDPLELTAYGLAGNGQLTVDHSAGALRLSGQARLDPFSPRALLARFDQPVPQSSDPAALTRAQLAASFETTGASGRFRDIAITLDDSRITGEFSVEDFANPAYRFVLRADDIDADRYLPPKTPAGAAAAAAVTEPGSAAAERRLGDIRLASEALTANRITGSASVGNLKIGGMRFEQLSTDLVVGDGRGELANVRTRLYGGDFAGGVLVDSGTEVPTLRLTGNARALAMQPLLTDMLGDANLSGSGDFELDLTGRGETIGRVMETAQGSMRLSLREGILYGVNIGHGLCKAMNTARQLPAPPPAPEQTPYLVISGSATVSEGLATSPDLYATTGYLDLRGQGRMRLVDQTLDTSFVARMTGPVNLPGCERLNSRVEGSVPFNFTLKGQLPEPEVGFDIGQLVEDMIRREIRNQAQDALSDALRRALE